jgi:hypothetical protein
VTSEEQLREVLEQVRLIRSDLDSLLRRVQAIEDRDERLKQGLLELDREFGAK